MSRKKATVAEIEYIEKHRNRPIQEIADELNRTYEFVRKRIRELPEESVKARDKYITTIHDNGIVNKTANGRKGVSVMTEQASQRIDERRKKRTDRIKNLDNIHVIRKDDDS